MRDDVFLVAGTRPWNRRVFDRTISRYPGTWRFLDGREPLTLEGVRAIDPRCIFFLHWSTKVPNEIVTAYECICFHMTDLPFGRGGSPLQNLILRGHKKTMLSALRMTDVLDAGPIYLKEEMSLEGSAEEIYIRATELSARMIRRILEERPSPQPQQGEPTVFQRRRPEESRLPEEATLEDLFDRIRMLDAEDYPHAFLDQGGFRFEFRRAALRDGRIRADVTIRSLDEGRPS